MAKLFMVLLGCTPPGRLTEQHDVFFGIADSLKELVPAMRDAWSGANVHIDAWREVSAVDGNAISVAERGAGENHSGRLFFVNLGGYKPGELEEFHYKMLVVARNKGEAVKRSKLTAFYKHTGFKGAASHVDDLYGVDADDVHDVEEILDERYRSRWSVRVSDSGAPEDKIHPGYLQLHKIE